MNTGLVVLVFSLTIFLMGCGQTIRGNTSSYNIYTEKKWIDEPFNRFTISYPKNWKPATDTPPVESYKSHNDYRHFDGTLSLNSFGYPYALSLRRGGPCTTCLDRAVAKKLMKPGGAVIELRFTLNPNHPLPSGPPTALKKIKEEGLLALIKNKLPPKGKGNRKDDLYWWASGGGSAGALARFNPDNKFMNYTDDLHILIAFREPIRQQTIEEMKAILSTFRFSTGVPFKTK